MLSTKLVSDLEFHRRIGSRLSADIVLPHYRVAVYVDGCFWHNHGCRHGGGKTPAGPNTQTWAAKFESIKERERRSAAILEATGYAVVRVWECQVKRDPRKALARLIRVIEERA